jgi:LytS/YehU family sensor histidine kinase
VEPHFLFNTLASVQFLTETEPREASRLLGHLIDYLRAALPQLRAATSTLGREFELAQSYLAILQTRMGPRLAVTVDLPAALHEHIFPPNMLMSLVENAIKHGLEPAAAGGTLSLTASRQGERVVVAITDTGRGMAGSAPAGGGFGLANIRERLETLYGARARFALEPVAPAGTRAIIEIPHAPGA